MATVGRQEHLVADLVLIACSLYSRLPESERAKFRQEHRYVLADIGGELAARRTAFYADLAGRIAALSEGGAAW
jgi:hypothetical protein